MKCPACNADVPAAEIHQERKVAQCPECKVSIELAEGDDLIAVSFRQTVIKGLVIEIDEAPGKTNSSYRHTIAGGGRFYARASWRPKGLIKFTFFAIFFNGLLGLWWNFIIGINALRSAALPSSAGFFILIALTFGAVGASLAWRSLTGWLNHTRIRVENGHLRCAHRPFPVLFEKMVSVRLDEVERFVVKETKPNRFVEMISRYEAREDWRRDPRKNWRIEARKNWRIEARMKTGISLPVATCFREESTARFVAHRLEAHL